MLFLIKFKTISIFLKGFHVFREKGRQLNAGLLPKLMKLICSLNYVLTYFYFNYNQDYKTNAEIVFKLGIQRKNRTSRAHK
jgi:hypothetical protein